MFLHISAEKPATQEAAVGTQSNLPTITISIDMAQDTVIIY